MKNGIHDDIPIYITNQNETKAEDNSGQQPNAYDKKEINQEYYNIAKPTRVIIRAKIIND